MPHFIHGTVSAKAAQLNLPIEHFIGFRIECEECVRPFRTFRPDETHCGCCREPTGSYRRPDYIDI